MQLDAKFPDRPSGEQDISQAPEPQMSSVQFSVEILEHESNSSNYGNNTESQFSLAQVWSSTHGGPSLPLVT